jgi:HSP20 family molecular chaperone IbpA
MTTRLSIFSSPFLLGFDQFERTLDRLSKCEGGYPPYNIEQLSETALRITLAVAGFTPAELSVQIEDNQLVVRGRQKEDEAPRAFLHRGIAARQFQRAFVLAEGIEVVKSWLDNGLLHIDLSRPIVEPKITTIPIHSSPATSSTTIDVGASKGK